MTWTQRPKEGQGMTAKEGREAGRSFKERSGCIGRDDRPAPPCLFSSHFYFKLTFLAPQTPVPMLCIVKMIFAKQWWPRL